MLTLNGSLGSVAHVGTFPPTQCGLATFGAALVDSLVASDPGLAIGVVEVTDEERRPSRGVDVQWRRRDTASLRTAIQFIDAHDAVVIQHEFGIYGGEDGCEVLDLARSLRRPVVTVLHTVLDAPSPHQRSIVEMLALASDAIVVMTRSAHGRLLSRHAIDPRSVHVIPHGAHPNMGGSDSVLKDRPTILTWGLLGPGKGIEAGIDAMRRLDGLIPAPRYVVAGQTHPKVRARSGELYRRELMSRAAANGVQQLVDFDDSYRDVESLKRLIRSADVVLVPYESREQVTSGVLIEAVASGKPVVATDFPHARELLASGAGIVVPHDDVDALAHALETVLAHPRLAEYMRQQAARLAGPMLWPAVGRRYLEMLHHVVDMRYLTHVPTSVA